MMKQIQRQNDETAFLSYNNKVQQYFVDSKLKVNDQVALDKDVIHHLRTVLRKNSNYIFRLCDIDGKIFHCHLLENNMAEVLEELDEKNELQYDITCILSLIKNDKLEFTIQKLVELGIKRIVLYQAKRSVVILKDEKKLKRLNKIILEASEQSHRNRLCELYYCSKVADLSKYLSEYNYICYENERNINDITKGNISYIIGPEGGFDNDEYVEICKLGFESISLGKRILRAETAAIYMSSVIVSKCQ